MQQEPDMTSSDTAQGAGDKDDTPVTYVAVWGKSADPAWERPEDESADVEGEVEEDEDEQTGAADIGAPGEDDEEE